MKLNTSIIAGAGIVWIGTLVSAFYIGKNQGTSAGSDSTITSVAAGPAGANAGSQTGKGGVRSQNAETPDKPQTVKQILARMKAAMRGGGGMQNPAAMMKVMGMMDKIRMEDIPEALAEAESTTDPQQKMMLYMALLGKWAESDGPAAMKYAEEHSTNLGMMSQIAKMSVAGAWAEKDPEAVWKWYKGQEGKDTGGMLGGNMVLASLFSNMAANDPDMAFKRLEEIEGPGRNMAIAGMFQSALFDDAKREVLLKKVESLPDESERKQAKQMMLGQWTMMAPDQAAAWVKAQPTKEQSELRESVGSMLMMSDPKKGAAFMLDGASEEEKPKRYASIVGQWAHMDTNAAGTWLREQPQGPYLDDARHAFVAAASQKDPESAMVWAGTITSPDRRVTAISIAYHEWQKKDAAAADRALTASGLSDDQIHAVKTSAEGQPPPPQPSPAH